MKRTHLLLSILFSLVIIGCKNPNSNQESNEAGKIKIGTTGPGGGIVFYDKGFVSDDWRYIEVTKTDVVISCSWGGYLTNIGGTSSAIGTSKYNTDSIVAVLGNQSTAANYCQDLISGGYSDWNLPSIDELNLIYTNLKVPGYLEYVGDKYWSSTEWDSSHSHFIAFSNGYKSGWRKDLVAGVRAIRYFK